MDRIGIGCSFGSGLRYLLNHSGCIMHLFMHFRDDIIDSLTEKLEIFPALFIDTNARLEYRARRGLKNRRQRGDNKRGENGNTQTNGQALHQFIIGSHVKYSSNSGIQTLLEVYPITEKMVISTKACVAFINVEQAIMRSLIVTGVTFGVFMTEAIIHYNMGKADANGRFRLQLPPPKELAKIAAVTGVFSILSGAMISGVEKRLPNIRI